MTQLPSRRPIADRLFADETAVVRSLAAEAALAPDEQRRVAELARQLVAAVRAGRRQQGGIDAFMQEYSLSSEEGVVLMCLAEALLRIPDAGTADKLIADKIGGKDWDGHLGQSDSLFVNASAWGLMLTGRFVDLGREATSDIGGYVKRLVSRSGEPIIRNAMKQAMRIMGKQFVLGRTIDEALAVAKPQEAEGYRFSYDMLGEAAFTMEDADRYYASYANALKTLGAKTKGDDIFARASISVKLSALHPRYEEKQEARVMAELLPRVADLAAMAKAAECRSHHRCGRGEPPRSLARTVRTPGAESEPQGLERPGPRRAGLQQAGKAGAGVAGAGGRAVGPAHSGPAGQGRLLGHRGEARAGAGLPQLPAVHPQGFDGCQLPRLRPLPAWPARSLLSAVRHPQCPYAGGHLGHGGQ